MTNFEELKRLALAATPGEWCVFGRTEDGNGVTMVSAVAPANDMSIEGRICEVLGGEHDDKANAAYVAAANPAAILELHDLVTVSLTGSEQEQGTARNKLRDALGLPK